MATSLRRLATNTGNAFRSASSLHSRIPSKFLCTAMPEIPSTATPEIPTAVTPEVSAASKPEPFDLEASRARRAAFSKARKERLERIADEVMALDKIEYQDYAALLRDKLCRGEKSLFDVKLEKFDPEAKFDVIRAMLDFDSDLDLQGINDLLVGAPSVVKKDVTKEQAEKIVQMLKEAGATAVIE